MKTLLSATTLIILMLFNNSINAQLTYENYSDVVGFGQFGGLSDCIVDMNGDFLDDIVVVNINNMVIHFQQEDGSYIQENFVWSFTAAPSWSICAGDFNEDGVNDLIMGDSGKVSLFKSVNQGESYIEVAYPDFIFAQRSSAIDIDNDGHLDAFVCNDDAQNHVFRNSGDGNLIKDNDFLPTPDLAGNYASTFTDYDNDGDQDLYITKCYVSTTSINDPERINLLFQNNGDGTFTEVGASANMNDNAQSWVANFEDFDNDGDFDAFIANHDFGNRFMINNGDGTFTDIIETTGLDKNDLGAWQSFTGDFNNDGFIDLMIDTKKTIYLNNGDLTFTPQDVAVGQFNRGAIGDLNNDGHLDFITRNLAWVNTSNEGNWFKVYLKGTESNFNGIGSRVELHGEWGMQIREVRSGTSYSSMSSLNTHFGIGDATAIDSLVVKWPSGIKRTIVNPSINSNNLVIEVECIIDFIATLEGPSEICPGEEVILSAPSGYDNYSWSNGQTTQEITVGQAGNYFVDVSNDDGCAGKSQTIEITMVPDSPASIFPSGDLEMCSGDSFDLTASSNQATITWNDGSTASSILITGAGQYFVETTSICNGEILTSEIVTVEVVTPSLPIVSDVTISPGTTATLTAQGNLIEWFDMESGGEPIATGESFTTPIIDMNTIYYVENTVLGMSGLECTSDRVAINIGLTGTEEIIQELGITIYPNPASDKLIIEVASASEIQKVELINNLGQVVSRIEDRDLGQHQLIFNLNNVSSGNYTIKMLTSKGIASKNIVVNR